MERANTQCSRMSSRLLLGLALVVAHLPCHGASPKDIQTIESLRSAVARFAESLGEPGKTSISVDRMDARLRLPRCIEPLTLALAAGARPSGRTTVNIRCAAPRPWALAVGVTIDRMVDVLVAKKTLDRGARISQADVAIEQRRESALPPTYLGRPDDAAGRIATRQIVAGTLLADGMLKMPRLIRRGDRVTLSWQGQSLAVRISGEALADAVAGERVRVRNKRSKRIVEGIAVGPGLVVATTSPLGHE